MEFTVWTLAVDLGLVSLLLLFGQLLRTKVKIVQASFLPASIIAGVIGLILGPNVLALIPFSEQIAAYPEVLIAAIFAALPLGQRFNVGSIAGRVGTMWAYSQAMMIFMWGLGVLLAITVLGVIWDLPRGFGLMLASGFAGGHGSAAAVGSSFSDLGWQEATSLAYTSATVGVIIAIAGGLLLVKWGTRTGRTNTISNFSDLPAELKTGVVPSGRRKSIGEGTVSPISLEPLAFHLGLILAVVVAAYGLGSLIGSLLGDYAIPTFALAFLVGLVAQFALSRSGAGEYVDRSTVSGITGTATDLLVAFGIASIVPTVVADYIAPLTLLMIFGVLYCLVLFRYLAPKIFPEYAFEKGLFTWGWSTGAVAMGIALLRIVDPELESGTLDDFGVAYIPVAPVEVALVGFSPLILVSGFAWPYVGGCLAIGAIALLLSRALGWWNVGESPTKVSKTGSEAAG